MSSNRSRLDSDSHSTVYRRTPASRWSPALAQWESLKPSVPRSGGCESWQSPGARAGHLQRVGGGRAQVSSQRARHPPGADAPKNHPPPRPAPGGFPTFPFPESGAQPACKKSLFSSTPHPVCLSASFFWAVAAQSPLASQSAPRTTHTPRRPLPGGDPEDPSPQGPDSRGPAPRARCPEGLLRFPGTLNGKRGVGEPRAGWEPGEPSGCGPEKGAGSAGRRGEEATQGLSVSWGLIGGWPDESELGARPSPLAPARAGGSAPPRSRFVPADGGRGCGEERAGGTEPGTHGPRDRRRGAPRTAPRPGPRAPRPPPRARTGGQVSRQRRARSHRPRGRRSRRLSPCRRFVDAQQVGYVTAPARSPLRPVQRGLRAAPRPWLRARRGAGERGGVRGLGRGAEAADGGGSAPALSPRGGRADGGLP